MTKLLIIFSATFFMASCSKDDRCIECHYENNGQNVTSGTVCGTTSEVKSVQVDWQKAAEDHGTNASCAYH